MNDLTSLAKKKNHFFLSYFQYDLKAGLIKRFSLYLLPIFVGAAACLLLLEDIEIREGKDCTLTWIDLLFGAYRGCDPYDPLKGVPFSPPFLWISCVFFCLIPVLQYPYSDYVLSGKNIFPRTKSRKKWWFSKCLFSIFSVTVSFLLQFGTICAVAGIRGKLTQNTSSFFPAHYGLQNSGALGAKMFFEIWFAIAGLGLLQTLLTFIFKPPIACLAVLTFLLAGAFFQNPFLLSCYAMTGRYFNSSLLAYQPVTAAGMVVLLVLLTVLVTLYGVIVLERKDIL